nr:hypothetical protein [Tanacetum cinerariifolium]
MHPNRGIIADLDADKDVTLEEVDAAKDADVEKNAYVQERLEESQAKVYHIDLEHADKVLSMQDDEPEPVELKEVIEVVTTTKLMTEVVTSATTLITAAIITVAPSAAKRRKGVVIRDPEETAATLSTIVHSKPKSKDKGKGIMVKKKGKQDNAVLRYQSLKRKPQTEAQAKKNLMLEEEESRALKRQSESSEEKATKKQKLDEEVEELKKHLQIMPNDDDDVYTKATPLALKIILLVERRYPLTKFTLDQMLNNVRLEVEEESEVSLELLRFVRRQQEEGIATGEAMGDGTTRMMVKLARNQTTTKEMAVSEQPSIFLEITGISPLLGLGVSGGRGEVLSNWGRGKGFGRVGSFSPWSWEGLILLVQVGLRFN